VTLNDLEWPYFFALNFAFRRYALKPGFGSLATLVNVVGERYTKKNSCGIARFPCIVLAMGYQVQVQVQAL